MQTDHLNRYYFDHFQALAPKGRLFPHVKEILKKARSLKLRLFIYSTVRQSILDRLCRKYSIQGFFSGIDGGIRDKKKSLKSFLIKNTSKPNQTLFIGDTEHDIMAAQRNHVASGTILCGYQTTHRLLNQVPDFVWNDHRGLLKFLSTLQAPSPLGKRAGVREGKPIPTVGALIFNRGDIFLIQTHKWGHRFSLPGGKIEKGEKMEKAITREIWEETRMSIKNVRLAMIQESIDSREFYKPNHHQILINYTAQSSGRRFKLNDEAESGFWINPQVALKLNLNTPTRILLETLLKKLTIPLPSDT